MDQTLSWLRYMDADEMEDAVDFDGLDVQSPSGEHLGDVDGFIVDADSARPYYVVVDSGGWFKSKHFLMPIGHVRLNPEGDALVASVTRDRIERFPGFDKDEFEKLSDEDLKHFNDQTCQACSITMVTYAVAEPYSAAWDRPDYRYPDWWQAQPTLPERMGAAGVTAGAESKSPRDTVPPARSDRDMVRAREDAPGAGTDVDPSPHFGGRAQPGDVIGVETGGERTYVGDTAEDENERRREAEEENRGN